MKFSGILICLSLLFFAVNVRAQKLKLPAACRQILNKKFSGWKLVPPPQFTTSSEPNLINGDWNGDRAKDYAILIKPRRNAASIVVIFVRTRTGYRDFVAEGGDYLQLFKKGEKDYSYDWDKNFIYQNDAIFVGVGECCGSSLIWRKNKFISTVTSD